MDSKQWKDTEAANYQSKNQLPRAAFVSQLTARSLPISEDPGPNPVIGNFYFEIIVC